jgi:hypothetical protein
MCILKTVVQGHAQAGTAFAEAGTTFTQAGTAFKTVVYGHAYAGTAVFGGDSSTQPKAMKPTPTSRLTVAKSRSRNVNSHVKTVRCAMLVSSVVLEFLFGRQARFSIDVYIDM